MQKNAAKDGTYTKSEILQSNSSHLGFLNYTNIFRPPATLFQWPLVQLGMKMRRPTSFHKRESYVIVSFSKKNHLLALARHIHRWRLRSITSH